FAATDYGSVTLKELGPIAPTIINILPYIGNSGMFIMGDPKQRAMMEDGLALEYYRFYDVNWFHPQKHTTRVHEIPLDRLKGCAASVQSLYPDIAEIYLAATGDEDGVEDVNGTKVFLQDLMNSNLRHVQLHMTRSASDPKEIQS
ncbi:mycE, partial [Symbiodinium sp. KB8]